MDSRWVKGLTGDAKKERIEKVKSFKEAFEELHTLLSSMSKKSADRDYSPGWTERQIALNEYNAAIETVKKLIIVKD